MTLSALIRKRDRKSLATATPAISATQTKGKVETIARVATVAVANPKGGEAAAPTVGPGESVTASRWWRLQYPDGDTLEVGCCPDATYAEILQWHPDSIAAEPFTPTIRQPPAPLTADEETAIWAWLALIEETNPATTAAVIGRCQRDADARDYFTGRAAAELPKPALLPDDRRTCEQCANLIARRCQAAKRGEIAASLSYEPIRDLPRRCEGYAPRAGDPDRRSGRERWPGLCKAASGAMLP